MEWGDDWLSDAPHELVELTLSGIPSVPEERPVIMSRCFPSKMTAGYSSLTDRRVLAVNGEPVVNVRQMYGLVERLHHEADHLHFELKCVGGNAAVVVETATAIAVRDDILETYRIPAHASKDLLEGGVA